MAEEIVYTKTEILNHNERLEEHVWTWEASSSGGAVTATPTDALVKGWVIMGETDPGTPAPTADYDVALNDSRGVDVFGGELADRSATLTEQAMPKIGNAYGERFVNSVLTMALTGNSVNSAQGEVRVLVRRGSNNNEAFYKGT